MASAILPGLVSRISSVSASENRGWGSLMAYASAPGPIATLPSERTGEMSPKTLPSGSIR